MKFISSLKGVKPDNALVSRDKKREVSKPWLKSYLYNLGTLIMGLVTSTILVLNKPSIGIGIFYFIINVIVGSVVWSTTNKMTFKNSLLPTFVFYAATGACGILAVLIGDSLLDFLKTEESSLEEIPKLAFYSFLVGIIPSLCLNGYFYTAIKKNIPEMQEALSRKFNKSNSIKNNVGNYQKSGKVVRGTKKSKKLS